MYSSVTVIIVQQQICQNIT